MGGGCYSADIKPDLMACARQASQRAAFHKWGATFQKDLTQVSAHCTSDNGDTWKMACDDVLIRSTVPACAC